MYWHCLSFCCSLLVIKIRILITGNSIFTEETEAEKSAFDKWVLSNYTNPYNILLKYRMEDKESDMTHVLVPASYEKSVVLAKIVKHVWLEAYDEATGNPNFLRHYVPKILHFVRFAGL